MRFHLAPFMIPFGFIAFWQIISSLHMVSPLLIPPPLAVAEAFSHIFFTKIGLGHILSTAGRASLGLISGVTLGLFAGVIIGTHQLVRRLSGQWVDFMRSIPAPALIPLFLLLFGIGESPRILLIIVVVGLLMIVSTIASLDNGSPTRIFAALSLGYTKRELLVRVIIPDALPQLSAGFRLAISFSLILAIIGEMFIGTQFGIGRAILDAQLTYETPTMYAYIIIAGILGQVSNTLYDLLEQKYIHWKGK